MQCMKCICNCYDSEEAQEFWYGEEKGFFLADVCVGQGGRGVAFGVLCVWSGELWSYREDKGKSLADGATQGEMLF